MSSSTMTVVITQTDAILPAELIMECISMLDVREIISCMLVSRRFFLLASGVLRQKTCALLYREQANIAFEIGLPSDASRRRHTLKFSHLDPYPFETHNISTLEWHVPCANFTFENEDSAFPINIETPFETFQTVLWGLWMNRSIKPTPSEENNPYLSRYRQNLNKALVLQGLERIHEDSFSPAPISQSIALSDRPASTLRTTFIPSSKLQSKSSHFQLSSPSRPADLPRRSSTVSCDTYGLRFEGLSVNCGSVLIAHERWQKEMSQTVMVIL